MALTKTSTPYFSPVHPILPPTPIVPSTSNAPGHKGRKRKRDTGIHVDTAETSPGVSKRTKAEKAPKARLSKKQLGETISEKNAAGPKAVHTDTEEEDEQNSDLERTYLAKQLSTSQRVTSKALKPKESSHEKGEEKEEENDDEEEEEEKEGEDEADSDDSDVLPPVHETHAKSPKRTKSLKKAKYVLTDETSPQRDARTIFVGNVAAEVLKSKSAKKQLKRHFLSFVPEGLIESMRFRSVAFSTPTAPLEDDPLSAKEKRQIERTALWRATKGTEEKDEAIQHGQAKETLDGGLSKKPGPETLTPAGRKRIAFIKRDFHQDVDTVNAYIVFGYKSPPESEAIETTHPSEMARLAVERGHGTVFMERTIRVDRVGQWRAGLPEDVSADVDTNTDPRSTVFVGNLDFAAKDEELRDWFEANISKERGAPPAESEDDDDDGSSVKRRKGWVKSVRIIRDRDTQLGKGFAYVQLLDRDCVDEVLNLDLKQIKFAKRCLRIQRCKGVPGATPKTTKPVQGSKSSRASKKSKETSQEKGQVKSSSITVPKGDPNLGSRLAGLSKEDRKAAKAADMTRIQRRLAKKKAKTAAKLDRPVAEKLGRDRERRKKTNKIKSAKSKPKVRPRSERSIEKRNEKK